MNGFENLLIIDKSTHHPSADDVKNQVKHQAPINKDQK